MDEIAIDKLGILEQYEQTYKYLKWFNTVKNAETGDYMFSPFGDIAYPEYPAFTYLILEAIRSEYIDYLVESRPKS